MSPLLVVVPLLVVAVVVFVGLARLRRKEEGPPPWGDPLVRERDGDALASAYRCRPTATRSAIGDRTWRDLSLDAVFARIDRCVTSAGQQALYRRLREPSLDPVEIALREQRVSAFAEDRALCDGAFRALAPLAKSSTLPLAPILYGAPPAAPRGAALFPLATLATVIAAAASFVWPLALAIVVLGILVSIAIRFQVHEAMSTQAFALAALMPVLVAAQRLARLEHRALRAEVRSLEEALGAIEGYRASMSWLGLDALRMNEIAATIVTYLNVFFLLDVHAFVRWVALVRRGQASLVTLLETVGELDCARAIASFRAGTETSTPEFTERGSPLVISGMVHPLVPDAVRNDLRMDRASGWLIMGSNMSGKSTFLRAAAINVCLAQSIGCVTARTYSGPVLQVRTLMQIEDDLLAGKSHFLVEAYAARDMLLEPTSDADRLCVIDELFRGTNTADRVASAAAFLGALSRGGAYVCAATHDAELIALLSREYLPHYFTEKVEGSALTFDHRLHEGPMAPRNALAVLELVGFPEDVLASARALSR